jgi:hypothetical protein
MRATSAVKIEVQRPITVTVGIRISRICEIFEPFR